LRGNGKGYGRCGEQTDLESDGRAVAHVCLENRKPSGAPQGAGNAKPSGYRPSLDAALNQYTYPLTDALAGYLRALETKVM
jgi:hypothetical protein